MKRSDWIGTWMKQAWPWVNNCWCLAMGTRASLLSSANYLMYLKFFIINSLKTKAGIVYLCIPSMPHQTFILYCFKIFADNNISCICFFLYKMEELVFTQGHRNRRYLIHCKEPHKCRVSEGWRTRSRIQQPQALHLYSDLDLFLYSELLNSWIDHSTFIFPLGTKYQMVV